MLVLAEKIAVAGARRATVEQHTTLIQFRV